MENRNHFSHYPVYVKSPDFDWTDDRQLLNSTACARGKSHPVRKEKGRERGVGRD